MKKASASTSLSHAAGAALSISISITSRPWWSKESPPKGLTLSSRRFGRLLSPDAAPDVSLCCQSGGRCLKVGASSRQRRSGGVSYCPLPSGARLGLPR